jgi:tripartite ATP-independent transporter DctP family solute receptor
MKQRTAVILAFAACLLCGAPALAQETISLRFAHSLSTNEPFHQAAEFFAKNMQERTKGRVQIRVFPGEQLGSLKDTMDMIRQGSNVIVSTDSGYLADFVPDFGILNGPYLLKDPADFKKLLASDWYREIVGKAHDAGFQVLAFNWFFGARQIIGDRPVRNLQEMKGLSIRVPPVPMFIETFKALGARGVTLNFSEVYTGLQQKVVDAAEAPLPTLYGVKLYETSKVITMTSHFTAFLGLSMNAGVFDKLPQDVKTALLEEAVKAGDHMTRLTEARQLAVIKDFEGKGVKFISDVNIPEFQKATAVVYTQFPKWTPGLYDRVRKLLTQ